MAPVGHSVWPRRAPGLASRRAPRLAHSRAPRLALRRAPSLAPRQAPRLALSGIPPGPHLASVRHPVWPPVGQPISPLSGTRRAPCPAAVGSKIK
jgi:hypothetical protein